MLYWIFLFLTQFVCCEICAQSIELEHRVMVACAGHNLSVKIEVGPSSDYKEDVLQCPATLNEAGKRSCPWNDIYRDNVMYCCHSNNGVVGKFDLSDLTNSTTSIKTMELKNLSSANSGEYHCRFKSAKAYWFLLVRDNDYKEQLSTPVTIIIVSTLTLLLLIFTIIGSVYIFKQHLCNNPLNGEKRGVDGQQPQKFKVDKDKEEQEGGQHVKTVSSSPTYASLQPDSGSIYNVLDQSTVDNKHIEREAKISSKDDRKHREQTQPNRNKKQTQPSQNEGIFESVYENI